MKISLSILTLIVLLFGCGSVPEEKPAEEAAKQPEQESKQETAKPVEKKQEQKQETIVEQTIFLLAEESSRTFETPSSDIDEASLSFPYRKGST